MKIAVIGAGIFGITSALLLDKAGHDVVVYEMNSDILTGASFCNQLRLHRGYHYPRSPETVDSLLRSYPLFKEYYGECIVDSLSSENYYCIAKEGSLVSTKEYIDFCKSKNLRYNKVDLPYVSDKIDTSLLVLENLVDYRILKESCYKKLNDTKIQIKFGTKFDEYMAEEYDYVVNCTYSRINDISQSKREYQFELCEKIVAHLPYELVGISIVIMDGPFMCIDPYGGTRNHLLGNVVHAIRHTNIGYKPEIPSKFSPYIDNGFSNVRAISNFDKFIESGKEYIPLMDKAKYVHSMFTVRTVLPRVDKTDERPTLVRKNGKVIDVFSGKIDTCVRAAQQVVCLLDNA